MKDRLRKIEYSSLMKGVLHILNTHTFKDFNSTLVLALTVSLFLPFYVSVAMVSAITIMVLINYEKRAEAFREPYSKFIAVCLVVSFFTAQVYSNSVGMVYSMLALAGLISCFYIRSFMTRQLFNTAMDTACLCSVACAVVAILQKISTYPVRPSYRPVSVFTNANFYGTMVEFVVLIALYRLFTNSQNRKFYLLVIGANAVGVYLCGSMSSVLALGCAVLVMLALKGRFRTVAVLCGLGLVFVVSSFIFPEIFPRITIIDQSWEQRLEIWSTAIKGIENHPLMGGGLMSYQIASKEFFGYQTYHSHNLYLDTLLNFGFIGAGAIGFYLYTQGQMLLRRFRNSICSNMNVLLVAAISAVAIHGMTDVTILWIQTGMLFLLIYTSTGINSAYASRRERVSGMSPLSAYGVHAAAYFKN